MKNKAKEKLIFLINKKYDFDALVAYLNNYQTKLDADYLLKSFELFYKNIKKLKKESDNEFYSEYIRAYTLALIKGVVDINDITLKNIEQIISSALLYENNKPYVFLYTARLYKYLFQKDIISYIKKKAQILHYYSQAIELGCNSQGRNERNNFLTTLSMKKNNKNRSLFNNIFNKNDDTTIIETNPAIIDNKNKTTEYHGIHNYNTLISMSKKPSVDQINSLLTSYAFYNEHPEKIISNNNFNEFYAYYLHIYTLAIKKEIIKLNDDTIKKIEHIIRLAKTWGANYCGTYTHIARFYEFMLNKKPERYNIYHVIDNYDKAISLGAEKAPEEKKKFLKKHNLIDNPKTTKTIDNNSNNNDNNKTVTIPDNIIDDFDINLINSDTDLIKLTSKLEKTPFPFTLLASGPAGTGKSYYLRYLAKKINKKIIEKTAPELYSKYQGQPAKNAFDLFKEAEQQNATIILDEIDSITKDREKDNTSENQWRSELTNAFLNGLENIKNPFMATTNFVSEIDKAILRRFVFKIKFDYLTPKQIKYAFNKYFNLEAPNELMKLGGLTNGDFNIVKKKAQILDVMNDTNELLQMLKDEVSFKSSGIITYAEKNHDYDKNFINIEGNSLELYIKKIKENKINNFSILLYGPSGTGKSLYLRNLAHEMNYEIIERRASDILSEYHGKTEKNIANAFEEAKNRRAMLIFDEVDSFLINKNSSSSGNARITNEFLVQLENHPYPVCATTNYIRNIEHAAIRRFKVNAKLDYLQKDQYNYVYTKTFGYNPPENIQKLTELTPAIFSLAKEKVLLENVQNDENRIFEIFIDEVQHFTGKNKLEEDDKTYEKLNISPLPLYNTSISDNYDKILIGFVKIITDNGYGSGFFISNNGFILTNKHVVNDNKIVTIELFSGRQIPGEVIRVNSIDIALIKISSENKVYPLPIKTNELKTGSTVFSLGNPKNKNQVLSKGCITRYTKIEEFQRIETDCFMDAGSSGGPLFDEFGNVIGVNVEGWIDHTSFAKNKLGINLHLSINDALNSLNIKIS